MASARHMYPLDPEEESVLILNLLLTQVMLLLVGCVGAAVICGFTTGDWYASTLGMGWVDAIATSCGVLTAQATVVNGALVAALLYALAALGERLALRSEAGAAAVKEVRRTINGELPRLPACVWVPFMFLAGFAEELMFRYALQQGLQMIFATMVSGTLALTGAIVVSSMAFWSLHLRYRDWFSTITTLALSCGLGLSFAVSGSLMVPALAHALYDILDIASERMKMRRDHDYFGGAAPTRELMKEIEAQEENSR